MAFPLAFMGNWSKHCFIHFKVFSCIWFILFSCIVPGDSCILNFIHKSMANMCRVGRMSWLMRINHLHEIILLCYCEFSVWVQLAIGGRLYFIPMLSSFFLLFKTFKNLQKDIFRLLVIYFLLFFQRCGIGFSYGPSSLLSLSMEQQEFWCLPCYRGTNRGDWYVWSWSALGS